MWLVENPNLDVGWDLRPKLGMCSWRAVRLTLIMHFSHERLQHGLSLFLQCGSCKQVRKFACLEQHFPLGKILHPLISPVFAIYNPWIVLVAIYTVHSEKQETFWLHWTYSACTIPWEELFPAFAEADSDHEQGQTTEIPWKQQDIRWKHNSFKLWFCGQTKSWTECFIVECFFPDQLV